MKSFVALVRREQPVVLFLAILTGVFTIVGLVRQQSFLWVYLPALAASIAILVWIDRRWGPIPSLVLWMLSVWAGLHLAGGLAANPTGETEILYGMWIIDGALRYDQLVHGFGIGSATGLFVVAARHTGRPLLFGFLWAQLVGLVNEVGENVFAYFVENSNVGDAVNTAWDVVWQVIGGLIALMIINARGGAPAPDASS